MQSTTAANLEATRPVSGADSRDLDDFLASVERRALRTARIRLQHADDAMDAVQDAMLRLASRYADKPAEEWPPLFWSILRRRIIDLQRRRKVRSIMGSFSRGSDPDGEPYSDWEPTDPGAGPLHSLADRQAMQELEQALRELPQRQFEAFSLRILNELDGAGTARAMGCTEGSVKTHLSRARKALGKRLEDWQ